MNTGHTWEIKPREGIGPIRFGTKPQDYSSILKATPIPFRRTPDSNETLAFNGDQLHLEVDKLGRIVRITVFRPRAVSLSGIQLLGRCIKEVAAELSHVEVFCKCDAGLWSEELKVLLVEIDGRVDGVEVESN